MSDVAKRIARRLRRFLRRLKSGKPISAVQVTREHTPDGPLTIQRKMTL